MTTLTTERAGQLRDALGTVCAATGLRPDGAQLIKYTSNAVYRLSTEPVVVRLSTGPDAAARVTGVVRAATWLAQQDAPTARLLPGPAQPVQLPNGWAATIWTAIHQPAPGELGPADLARLIRTLHALPAPDWLPAWNPFTTNHTRLDHANGLSRDDLTWLRSAWTAAEADYRAIAGNLPVGLLHGDAQTGNLLRTTPGGPIVICDLDNVLAGPADWDLVATAIAAHRFGHPHRQTAFAAAYGRDVTTTAAWPILRRIRELVMVTAVVPDLTGRPEIAAQHAHRLRSLRTNDNSSTWRPY
jgi:aminoglycoside phosphotransferase (APT) family kinase protein